MYLHIVCRYISFLSNSFYVLYMTFKLMYIMYFRDGYILHLLLEYKLILPWEIFLDISIIDLFLNILRELLKNIFA